MKSTYKKINPRDFTYTGTSNKADNIKFDYYRYSKDECISLDSKTLKDIRIPKEKEYTQWIDISGVNNVEEIAQFCQKNEIHRLSIQNILDINQRPKFQKFDDYLFLTLKSLESEGSELQIEQISLIVKDNYLISFQEKNTFFFNHIKQRLLEGRGVIREKGTIYLLYTIIESVLDNYFKVINQIETKTDLITFPLNKEPSSKELGLLEDDKRKIYLIKKSILPLKEFTLKFEREELSISKDLHKYFFEIKDMCLTIIDECDIISGTIESNINLFFSVQGQRMNQIMKTLTVVATIFIPLTFIAGIYGMNFSNMPELTLKYGYAGVWGVFIAVFLALLIYFQKKGYF